jgi:hypothetical protein
MTGTIAVSQCGTTSLVPMASMRQVLGEPSRYSAAQDEVSNRASSRHPLQVLLCS